MDDTTGPDAAWFEQIWDDCHARIYNLAARIVGDRDDAADITQEVFLKAFTHPPDEKGMRDPQPWLYRVTVNACYDHLRRKAVRPTAPLENAGEIASARDGFAAAETTRAVESALGSLTPRYRTALVLRDLHGLETDEVAGVMGVNRATARVLLHRARASFKRAFRETAPAGTTISAAGLAAFLPALQAPAALQAPSLAGLAPAAPVALSALPLSAAPAAAGPAAAIPAAAAPVAGVLAKVGSAAGVKIAAVVAGAAIATGGAVAVHETAREQPRPARTAPVAALVHTPGPGATTGARSGAGPGSWASPDAGPGQGERSGARSGRPGSSAAGQGLGQPGGAGFGESAGGSTQSGTAQSGSGSGTGPANGGVGNGDGAGGSARSDAGERSGPGDTPTGGPGAGSLAPGDIGAGPETGGAAGGGSGASGTSGDAAGGEPVAEAAGAGAGPGPADSGEEQGPH